MPVYLLARRFGLGLLVSLWAGALTVAVPWIVLSSFLLTEVVAYPMFCWGLLALTHAVERKRWPTDVLAGWSVGAAWAMTVWTIALWLQRRGKVEQVSTS